MEETQFKGKGVLKWALTVGIIIVLNLFFWVAIETAYSSPDYEEYCPARQVNEVYEDEASCVAVGGQWNPYAGPKTPDQGEGHCYADFTCSQELQAAQENYAQNVFVVLVILGTLSIIGGFMLRMSPAVSAGLSYGGVLTFIIAAMRYWDAAGDLVRLAIVGIALVVLIVVGVKKFKE